MANTQNFFWRRSLQVLVGLSLASLAQANVVGVDTQNFNPTTDGLDFVTVHSSKTLQPGLFNLGAFLNYAVNSLPNYEDVSNSSRTNFSDALLSSDFNFGVGLMQNWDAGLSFPMLLSQKVDSDVTSFRGEFGRNGMTEIRVNSKLRFLGDQSGGLAAVASANFNLIENNPFSGAGAGPTTNFEFVADKSIDRYAVAANIGYRWRQPGTQLVGVPVEPIQNQYIASTAVSYLMADYDIKLIGEIFGSYPAKRSAFASDRNLSTLELLAGMKMDLRHDLQFHAGAGTEMMHGTASPDWRVYTGLNWVIGPVFSRPQEVIVRVDGQPVGALTADAGDPFGGQPANQEKFIARDVLFDFNSDDVQPQFEQVLQRLVDYLKRPPGISRMEIEGHTDSIGSDEYNYKLSLRRAQAVRVLLIKLGMPAAKVTATGQGEKRPIADNGNFQGRALNRRVEFKITR